MNAAFPVQKDLVRNAPPLPFSQAPRHVSSALRDEAGEVFDPKTHLALTYPDEVFLQDFRTSYKNKMPTQPPSNDKNPVAFTTAFSVLSPAGVRTCREVLKKNQQLKLSTTRTPHYYRALAYVSKFIRDFNESPEMLDHLSNIIGSRLLPNYLHSNYSHMNVSDIAAPGKPAPPVDSWHVDGVQFVLVTIISDMEGMIGGEFQAVKRVGREAALKLVSETNNNVPSDDIMKVSYAKQGFGIFMQGCDVLHRVTGVSWAKEPRITCINSYMLANVFAVDRTMPGVFTVNDKEAYHEIARGRAWRAKHQLEHLLEAPYNADRMALSEHLRCVASELQYTSDILAHRQEADVGYYDEKSGKVVPHPKSKL